MSNNQGTFSFMNEDLERVSVRIEPVILAFCKQRLRSPKDQFHMEDLLIYVHRMTGKVAPASPDRVLRSMREKGLLNYTVLDRRKSLYRVTAVKGVKCA